MSKNKLLKIENKIDYNVGDICALTQCCGSHKTGFIFKIFIKKIKYTCKTVVFKDLINEKKLIEVPTSIIRKATEEEKKIFKKNKK